MPHGDWDDVSPAGKGALRALHARGGSGRIGVDITGFRTATWKSLARYGLAITRDHSVPGLGDIVTLTASGLDSICSGADCFCRRTRP